MKFQKYFGKLRNLNITKPIILRQVHGHSMVPVLPPGTYVWGHIFVSKLAIGDTIIFTHSGREKIKRIADINGDKLYVLGDHPESSTDSRQFGWIEKSSVKAKVFWPHAPKSRAESADDVF